jgi:hypothetical protein
MVMKIRESSPLGPCNILGTLVRETTTRYVYQCRRDVIAFVSKRSPKIHLAPCRSCPDHPASRFAFLQQGADPVG